MNTNQVRRNLLKTIASLTLLLVPLLSTTGPCLRQLQAAEKAAPAPTPTPSVVPLRPLLDHPGILQSGTRSALENLLVEHQRLTGEHVVLGLFRSAGSESPERKAKDLFQAWELNSRKTGGNSILLTFFSNEKDAHFEIGYGMDSVFTPEDGDRIIQQFLLPDLDESGPNRALSLTIFEVLRTLDSPLVANGEAERTLRAAGFRGPWAPVRGTASWVWITGLILSGGLLLFTLYWLTAAEVHFSRFGTFRLRPWELADWRAPLIRMGILRVKESDSLRSGRLGAGGTHGEW